MVWPSHELEDQVALGVTLPRLDEGKVASDGLLHDIVLPVELPGLPGGGDDLRLSRPVVFVLDGEATGLDYGAKGRGREEGGHSRATSPHPLSQGSL